MNKTFEKIKEISGGILGDFYITEESNYIHDLKADSLDLMEIVIALEDEFNVIISDNEAEKIKTVGDCLRLVEKKLKEYLNL